MSAEIGSLKPQIVRKMFSCLFNLFDPRKYTKKFVSLKVIRQVSRLPEKVGYCS